MLAIITAILILMAIHVGTSLVMSALFGPKSISSKALKHKSLSSSEYGRPWPCCRGSVRLQGNVIWSTRILATGRKTNQGSGLGALFGLGLQATYTTTYSVSCAVGFGYRLGFGSANQFRRIYADGKILYNARQTDAATSGPPNAPTAAGNLGDSTITVFCGPGAFIKLNPGDTVLFNDHPEQLYEIQEPISLSANQSGVVGIFPALQSPENNILVIPFAGTKNLPHLQPARSTLIPVMARILMAATQ